MSKFWKAGPEVSALIGDYRQKDSDEVREAKAAQLKELLGCRLQFILHYWQDDLYLETPDDVVLNNCEEAKDGRFFQMIHDQ